jgi:hypothetical protein
MMIIKRREILSSTRYGPRSIIFGAGAIMTITSEADALKSPFVKGDLGGFLGVWQIPPTPL